jgi:putative transposase
MVLYRRVRVAGGTYFFTVALDDCRADLLSRHADALRVAWRSAGKRVPHEIIAAVILPDHLHALIRFPEGLTDYPTLWREIKKGFTRRLLEDGVSVAPRVEGGYRVWQRRYWEHMIRDEKDLEAHVHYIHYNPVKHGLVFRTRDWPHSTFHRYVAAGWLPLDWGDSAPPVFPEPEQAGE